MFINILFLIFLSCKNKNCESDLYTPNVPEDWGRNSVEDNLHNISCPEFGLDENGEYDTGSISTTLYFCNNRCSYNNNKYYCVSYYHLMDYLDKSCCKYKKIRSQNNYYEINSECGENIE